MNSRATARLRCTAPMRSVGWPCFSGRQGRTREGAVRRASDARQDIGKLSQIFQLPLCNVTRTQAALHATTQPGVKLLSLHRAAPARPSEGVATPPSTRWVAAQDVCRACHYGAAEK